MSVEEALTYLSLVTCIRIAPFAVYAAVSGVGLPRLGLLGIGLVFSIGYVARAGHGARLVWLFVGAVCYLAVSLAAHALARSLSNTSIVTPFRRFTVFVALYSLCLGIPGLLGPREATVFLPFGWELTLRSFSYVVETTRTNSTPRIRESLFFLLVDPTLFYPLRAVRDGGHHWTACLARMSAGLLLMLMNVLLLRPLTNSVDTALPSALDTLFLTPVKGWAHVFSLYVVHSGLAHFQIGALAFCGWSAQERYNWPLLATSPGEFWKRWNTYVRVWLEAYIFLPLATRAVRHAGCADSHARYGLQFAAVVVAFLVSGVLHDLYGLSVGNLALRWTPLFVFGAGVGALWQLGTRALRSSADTDVGAGRQMRSRALRGLAMMGVVAAGGVVLRGPG